MKVLGSQPCSTPFPPSLLTLSPFSLLLLENPTHVHCQRAPWCWRCLILMLAAAGHLLRTRIESLTAGPCTNITSLRTRVETRCCLDVILPWTPAALHNEAWSMFLVGKGELVIVWSWGPGRRCSWVLWIPHTGPSGPASPWVGGWSWLAKASCHQRWCVCVCVQRFCVCLGGLWWL